jgi:DNA polymerase lambda
MGVCRLPNGVHRRIDILSIPWEQKGAALLYFTGNAIVSCCTLPAADSVQFNRSMRLYARKRGFSLNQRGLYRNVIRNRQLEKVTEGEIVASRTEEEIFDILEIRWRPPHLRRP